MTASPRDVSNIVEINPDVRFSCLHLNIRSARHKEDELSVFLDEFTFEFDAVMLTETWYTCNDEIYKRDGYRSFFVNRSSRNGGGLVILLKNMFDCDILSDFSFISNSVECLTVTSNNSIYSVAYRPPDADVNIFIEFLDRLLTYVNNNKFNLILGGNFNIDLLKRSPAQEAFLLTVESNGNSILTQTATRVTMQTATLIDVFISNINISNLLSGVLHSAISDHFPIYVLAKCATGKQRELTAENTAQKITPGTLASFFSALSNQHWDDVFCAENADEAYEAFIICFKRIYHAHFPEKTVIKSTKSRKPWINRECLKMIRKKNQLYKKFMKTKSPTDLASFKKYRNKVTSFLKNEKRNFLHNEFAKEFCDGSAQVWKKVNKLLNRARSASGVTDLVFEGERIEGVELAEKFSTFFKDTINTGLTSDIAYNTLRRNNNSIFLEPTDEIEVCNIFSSFKNSRSCDIDGI